MSKIPFSELLYIKGRIGWQALGKDEYLKSGDYYLVTGVDITDENRINWDQCYYVSKERYDMDPMIQLKNGDIIVTKDGTIGKIGVIDNLEKPATLNSHLFLIRNIRPDILDTGYLFYVLRSDYFQKFASNNTSGSNIPAFTQANIFKFELELPTLEIQRKIASILSSIDSKIRNNNSICSDLESMAKLLYDYWFVQFDFPDENGKPYKFSGGKMVWNEELKREIPEGWSHTTLQRYIGRITNGLNPRKNFVLGHGDNYYITIKSLLGTDIDWNACDKCDDDALSKINNRSQLQIGDVVFSAIGTIGRTYYIQQEPSNWNISETSFTLRSAEDVPSDYFYSLLRSDEIQKQADQKAMGSTMRCLVMDTMCNIPYFDTPTYLMENFSKKVGVMYKKIHEVHEENRNLSSLRDFLLPMLMNGQVKVGMKL